MGFLDKLRSAAARTMGVSAEKEKEMDRLSKLGKDSEESAKLRDEVNFNAQCFLIDNTETLAQRNRDDTRDNPYKNFVMIEDGDPTLVTHEIVARKGVEALFNLTPAQKSLLVPKIQIFKVHYKNEDDKNPTEYALHFREHIEVKDILDISKSRSGRGDDVALKSFTYELAGKNPAEGGMVTCSLVLFFANAQTLLKVDENGIGWRSLLERHAKFTGKSNLYNPKYFQIKVVAGWAVPSDPKEVLITKTLRRAIEDSKIVLFLTLKDFDLNFEDNGTLKATLNYVGSMEGIMSNGQSDILAMTKAGEVAINKKKQLSDKEKQKIDKKEPKLGDKNTAVSSDDKDVAKISTDETKTSSEDKERLDILALQSIDKQIRYSKIVTELQKSGRMYYVDVSTAMIDDFSKEQVGLAEALKALREKEILTEEETKSLQAYYKEAGRRSKAKLDVRRLPGNDTHTNVFDKTKKGIVEANTLLVEKERDMWFGATTALKYKEKPKEQVDKTIKAVTAGHYAPLSKECPSCVRLHFFYLGDLLEIVFSLLTNPKRSDNKNVKVLLGPMIYDDPRTLKRSTINLADFPISLELFLAWYMKNVVAEQKARYFMNEFLKDLVTTLILPAFGEKCFYGASKQLPIVSINMFSVPAFGAGNKVHPFASTVSGGRYNMAALRSASGAEILNNAATHKSITELFHFIYIYVSNVQTTNLKGIYKEDIARGIYHFVPGLDRGLVKGISFSKNTIPYQSEAKVFPKTDTGQMQDNQIAMGTYNAKIKMVGNCLFRQGMLVYVDSSRLGLGIVDVKKKLAKDLFLGGYYLVTKVRHDFEDFNYAAEVEARWEAPAYSEKDAKAVSTKRAGDQLANKAIKATVKEVKLGGKTTTAWFDEEESK